MSATQPAIALPGVALAHLVALDAPIPRAAALAAATTIAATTVARVPPLVVEAQEVINRTDLVAEASRGL
ncbi:hypothetical protein SLS60_008699 [Paraconiothyrium brasiliense]|uniref:Uncharacterized protein n=1 Tax=Paraconiothyrium brasiliense TaxID=300254 RepID=A0ABR3QZD5_9PLEO